MAGNTKTAGAHFTGSLTRFTAEFNTPLEFGIIAASRTPKLGSTSGE
jgi:hypothetical protein